MIKKIKRILLLEAPYSYGQAKSIVGDYFPLGIGYIASYLRHQNYETEIFQPYPEDDFDEAFLLKLKTGSYDVVGISVMTSSYPSAVSICDQIKTFSKNIVTVMGGHHVSATKEDVLSQSINTDFIIYGEGEITFSDLLNALNSGSSDFSRIDGLLWRNSDGNIQANKERELISDIDSLPFPARNLMDMSRFRLHSYIDFGRKSATMVTSRGCPFKCMYCSSWITMGSRYRYRSVSNVMAEIKELVEVYGIDHIVFEDDTMTLNRPRMIELCDALELMPNRPTWYCLSRVDIMDYELAKCLKRAGCKMVNFGIESGSQQILDIIPKKITIEQAKKAISVCNKVGLRTQCTFIVGFPDDTKQTMKMTLDAAKEIKPTIAIFFPLTPYPGTLVYEKYLNNEIKPRTVNEWSGFVVTNNESGISVNSKYSGEEIKKIADEWNKKFYLRPSQLMRMTKSVSGFREFFRLAIAGWYLLKKHLMKAWSN